MRTTMRAAGGRQLVRVGGVVAAALLLVVTTFGIPAHAATASAYLSRHPHIEGPCSGSFYKKIGHYSASPSSWNSGWHGSHEINDPDSDFVTEVYYENGVKAYDRWEACRNGALGLDDLPTSYVHRYQYQEFLCDMGSGCIFMYTRTTNWASGTVFH